MSRLSFVGKHLEDLSNLFSVSFKKYQEYLDFIGLELAEHKTEAVLITGRKVVETITLRVRQHIITSQAAIRYLVMIDTRLNFKQQVEHAVTKASAVRTVLSWLMPNVGGPKQNRRGLLASVVTSVITYSIAIWAGALQTQETRRKVTSVCRLSGKRRPHRHCRPATNRSTSGWAEALVPTRESANTNAEQMKDEERQSSLLRWQQGWDKDDKGRWTYRLIPHLDKWINRRHGSVNYYFTQMLSGHGCFRAYLYKHQYEDSPECPICSGLEENAEHVFFACF